jgi:replicative DNA helicase Mcm
MTEAQTATTTTILDFCGDWCIELRNIARSAEFQREVSDVIRNAEYSRDRHPITIPLSKVRNNQLLYAVIESPDRQEAFLREALEIHEPRLEGLGHVYTIRFTQHPRSVAVKDIHSRDIGRLVAVRGIAKQVTEVTAKTVVEAFECRLCHTVQLINQSGRIRTKPVNCPGPGNENCRSRDFAPIIEQSIFCDNQKIRMQDFFDELKAGQQPETLDVEADDDLCHQITGGDQVVLTGILRLDVTMESKTTNTRRWLDLRGIEKVGEDSSQIEITDEDIAKIQALSQSPTLIKDLVASVAPKIYGVEQIKMAILLQQFGGVSHPATETTPAERGDFYD